MKRIMIAGWQTAEDKYEDYVQVVEALGGEGIVSLCPEELENCDALILPGSRQDMNPGLWGEKDICSNDINDELDAAQWKLMSLATKEWKPVLGICRGMQFINVYFGGTLIQDLPCAAAHKRQVPEQYHPVFHLDGSFMRNLLGTETLVNTRHHQGIGNIGRRLEVLSVWNDGEDSVVEAFRHRIYPIAGLQWHPEKMFLHGDEQQKEDAEKLLRYFIELKL